MSTEVQTKRATYESPSDDGLYQVILGAAHVVMGQDLDSPGVLEIQPEGQVRGLGIPSSLCIEAAFAEAEAERLIAKLDLRVRRQTGDLPTELSAESLASFGGLAFTNLCLGGAGPTPSSRPDDMLDITVSFPFRIPFLASNTLLPTDGLSAEEMTLCRSVLGALGVRHREADARLAARVWQIRRPMRPANQLAAFAAALGARRRVSIYAASLPPYRSVRLERGWVRVDGVDQSYIDLCLSQGLTLGRAVTQAEVQGMQTLLERHLGVEFGGASYRVASSKWTEVSATQPAAGG